MSWKYLNFDLAWTTYAFNSPLCWRFMWVMDRRVTDFWNFTKQFTILSRCFFHDSHYCCYIELYAVDYRPYKCNYWPRWRSAILAKHVTESCSSYSYVTWPQQSLITWPPLWGSHSLGTGVARTVKSPWTTAGAHEGLLMGKVQIDGELICKVFLQNCYQTNMSFSIYVVSHAGQPTNCTELCCVSFVINLWSDKQQSPANWMVAAAFPGEKWW